MSQQQSGASAAISHRDDPVHLTVSRYVSLTATGRQQVERIADERTSAFPTTCRLPSHYRARPRRAPGQSLVADLDCACDVGCPKCHTPVGMGCVTPTGYAAKTHWQRVEASPRCQGLLSGGRTKCDLGEHAWEPVGSDALDKAAEARCASCGRVEPIHTEHLPFNERYLRGGR